MTCRGKFIILFCILSASFSKFTFAEHSDGPALGQRGQVTNIKSRVTRHHRSKAVRRHHKHAKSHHVKVMRYFGGTPVITSPYLGIRSKFDGSDLIINLPSVNQDLRLLQQRYLLDKQVYKHQHKAVTTPLIELSGKVQARIQFLDPNRGRLKNDVNLDAMELDGVIHSHKWVTGLFAITYDNGASPFRVNRVSHSRVFLDEGFFMIGNLRESPFYFSAGQVVVPFGRYSSHMISATLVEQLGSTKQRAFTFGYKQEGADGFYASGFYFKGNVKQRGRNQGGAHLGYVFHNARWRAAFNASVLTSLADSQTLQMTRASDFKGFSENASTQHTQHIVPAAHAFVSISHHQVDVLFESVRALRSFSSLDLRHNGHGAKPWAINVEGAWHFNVSDKPAAVSVGYGQSGDAFALHFPQRRLSALVKASWWRDTIQAIEVRHDVNYRRTTTGAGADQMVSVNSARAGSTSVIAKMTIFF